MKVLLFLFALWLLGWFWFDSLRAKEAATTLCRTACAREGLQFLDQTVALRHLRPQRTAEGIRIRRVYRFEFSEEGIGRRTGYLILVGTGLQELSFGLPQQPDDA